MGDNSNIIVACKDCGKVISSDVENTRESYECPGCGSDNYAFYRLGEFSKPFSFTTTGSNKPDLLLKSVIETQGKTSEGTLIKAVALPWFEILKFIDSDPNIAFQLSPEKWEEIIAGAYKKAGFDEVVLTPRSGDYGRDVIAVKRGIGSIRVIDQVKAYKPNHKVTANDVRALVGVLQGDTASKGFLTTTSDFAPRLKDDPLIKPFIPSRIELINGKSLMNRLRELANSDK